MERKRVFLGYVSEMLWFCYACAWENNCSTAFDVDRRNTADNMQNLFSVKQFMASAYLFRETFAMYGPISRILQG